jgi:copper chaperone CopZ
MSSQQTTTEIKVAGMSCEHCVAAVENAAKGVPGVTQATVDLKAGTATVMGAFDRQQVIEAIKSAGYEAS